MCGLEITLTSMEDMEEDEQEKSYKLSCGHVYPFQGEIITLSVGIINFISFAINSERREENKRAPLAKIFLTFAKQFLYFAILSAIQVETKMR